MSQWQPMETAPMDGTDVLVFEPEQGEQFVVYWNGEDWQFAALELRGVLHTIVCEPTFWRPLPPSPKEAA